jgi:predicted O-methyltransferase YrrM
MLRNGPIVQPPRGAEDERLLWSEPARLGPKLLPTDLACLLPREQLLLYSLVFAWAPERCLEIGVLRGGGTRIIHAALSDLGRGVVVGLDPDPKLEVDWSVIADRAVLLRGKSPGDLERARDRAGGPFEFVFVDGDHSAVGVLHDLTGLVRVTEPGAIVLLHDAYFAEVERAIVAARRARLPYVEGPMLSRTPCPVTRPCEGTDPVTGNLAIWGGMRLLTRVDQRRPWWRLRAKRG